MIKVDRAKDTRPEAQRPAILDLDDPASPASVERQEAIDYYHPAVPHDPDNKPRKPTYSVYGKTEVKAALFNLFHNKCAYCEGKISGNQTGDIEHFRPKGSVKNPGETPRKPGYYWLAADWDNLYLGCQSCNTARKEPDRQADGTWTVAKDATGKKDQFPLSDPTRHLESPDDNLADEEPFRLLLDPCKENPEEFFCYKEDGAILPKSNDATSRAYEMAVSSIRVFDLKRYGLASKRKQRFADLWLTWMNIRQTKRMYIDTYEATPPARGMLEEMAPEERAVLEENSRKLIACIDGKAEFAGFCRHLLADFVETTREIRLRFEQIYGG